MTSFTTKIAIAVIFVVACGGTIIYLGRRGTDSGQSSALVDVLQTSEIHTADWYVAHPDILHKDEHRCAGDAATISQAACQNVASADARLNVIEMQSAASANANADESTGTKSQ